MAKIPGYSLHTSEERRIFSPIQACFYTMTLSEFFTYLGEHPFVMLAYFLIIPFTALLAGMLGKGEGHLSPWKYLYTVLIFAVCIPGIFAVAYSVYRFFFERGSIMNADMFVQVLPIVSMLLSLGIIRRNVSFDYIPGFDRITSLWISIAAIVILMYVADRTHIFAFVRLPVYALAIIVVGLLLVFRLAVKRTVA